MSLAHALEEAMSWGKWEPVGGGYKIQTPVGLAALAKNAKGAWEVTLNGQTRALGKKKPEFGHAEYQLSLLVNASSLSGAWKDGEYAHWTGADPCYGVVRLANGRVWFHRLKRVGDSVKSGSARAIEPNNESLFKKVDREEAVKNAEQAYIRVSKPFGG